MLKYYYPFQYQKKAIINDTSKQYVVIYIFDLYSFFPQPISCWTKAASPSPSLPVLVPSPHRVAPQSKAPPTHREATPTYMEAPPIHKIDLPPLLEAPPPAVATPIPREATPRVQEAPPL